MSFQQSKSLYQGSGFDKLVGQDKINLRFMGVVSGKGREFQVR